MQFTDRKRLGTRAAPPPAGFAEIFIRWGWRGVETAFGSRTPCNKRWLRDCGEAALRDQRRAYRDVLKGLGQ